MPRRKIIPYNPKLKHIARQRRNNLSLGKIKLWLQLKGTQMRCYDFHRQKPLGEYIVDFYCNELMLAIEVGGYAEPMAAFIEKNSQKEAALKTIGVHILYIHDADIFHEMHNVLLKIEAYIDCFEKGETHP